jgi:hypothetical protein
MDPHDSIILCSRRPDAVLEADKIRRRSCEKRMLQLIQLRNGSRGDQDDIGRRSK